MIEPIETFLNSEMNFEVRIFLIEGKNPFSVMLHDLDADMHLNVRLCPDLETAQFLAMQTIKS